VGIAIHCIKTGKTSKKTVPYNYSTCVNQLLQQTTNNKQQTTNNKQQTTNNKQLTTNN